MKHKSSIQMSQGYDVLVPRVDKAYPILCTEWERLKRDIHSISDKPNIYHSIGVLLLGSCLTTFITILTGSFSNPQNEAKMALVIAWAVVVVTLVLGGMCLFFSREQRRVKEMKASYILAQMDSIEIRYQDESNDSTLDESSASMLEDIILSQQFRLVFNPATQKSKIMVFRPGGLLVKGKNRNENTWRVVNDKLEFMNSEGKVFSRFYYDKQEKKFQHTNDEDTLSLRDQYMIPEE